jgi:hypothetical protein
MKLTLEKLAVDHDYYASGSNYYSNDCSTSWDSWKDFYEEFKNSDTDMNLVYRWDINRLEEGEYYMQIIIIGQRKGLYLAHQISNLIEEDLKTMVPYLMKSYDKLQKIWKPLNN